MLTSKIWRTNPTNAKTERMKNIMVNSKSLLRFILIKRTNHCAVDMRKKVIVLVSLLFVLVDMYAQTFYYDTTQAVSYTHLVVRSRSTALRAVIEYIEVYHIFG